MISPLVTPRLRLSLKHDEAPLLPKRSTSQILMVSSKLLLSKDSLHERRSTLSQKHKIKMTKDGIDHILQPPKRIKPRASEEEEEEMEINNMYDVDDDSDSDDEDWLYAPQSSSTLKWFRSSSKKNSNTVVRRSSDPMHDYARYQLQKESNPVPIFPRPLSKGARRSSKSDETHNISNNSSRQSPHSLFVERKIQRSVSLGGQRPCMKQSSLTSSICDTMILRPYRQLSSEDLFVQREESNGTVITNDTTDNNNDDIDSDCEGEVVPPLTEEEHLLRSDRSKTMNASLPSIIGYHVEQTGEQLQRPCMMKSRSFPLDMMTIRCPIMPLRQDSIRNLCACE